MTEYTKLADQAGDQVLQTVKRAYGIGVDAVSTASEWAGDMIPQLPELPYAERIPAPRELTKVYFDFVTNLTKLQKDYALGLLDAIEPVTKKVFPTFAKAKPAAARKVAAA
jgi:hypothetical protein